MTTRKNSKSKSANKSKARSLKSVAGFKDINVVTLSYDGSTVIKNKALQKSILDRIKAARKSALQKELEKYPVLKALPKVKGKETKIVIDSKSVLKKSKGRYVMDTFDFNNLMGTLVQLATLHQTKGSLFRKPGLITNVTDFSVSITYRNDGPNMRPMVSGSQRAAWRRKGEKD